ncbi:UvrD-helicase domain-containing protein [Streptomyces sp. CT34]|uniref:UvrD-helicase domain-containing protein n=1 Tax=Streptomyces sp. CT34 TaxID=1553907 RepID=UPI00099CF1A6|nr:UvrD-helicase domain-containing protein [Streptomyces sp. CT34]
MTDHEHADETGPLVWERRLTAWKSLVELRQAAAGLTKEAGDLERLDAARLRELQGLAERAVADLEAIGWLTAATPPPRHSLSADGQARPHSPVQPVRSEPRPTEEQEEVADGGASGANMVVDAGAGTGKTTTLVMTAARMTGLGLYTSFTRSSVESAKSAFPDGGSVSCKTAHSLAFAAVGHTFQHRLKSARLTGAQQAEVLGIRESLRVNGQLVYGPAHLAQLATQSVERWCHSADRQIEARHIVVPPLLTPTEAEQLRAAVLPYAWAVWADLSSREGRLRFTPDVYLKLWALGAPLLPYAYILLDEAQDANPVVAQVIQNQSHAQLIAVGDSCQQLYEWRGAVDAMATWPAERRLMLSQSWRFGPAVAEQANRWLRRLETRMRLTGSPHRASRVIEGGLDDPDAILCRTNGRAILLAIEALAHGRRPALVGGTSKVKALAKACQELKETGVTGHPELLAFTSWDDVHDYAATDDGADLKALVEAVDTHGAQAIIKAADRMAPDAKSADLVISTAHRAKGLEWGRVRIATDFPPPPRRENGSVGQVGATYAMLAYVAVTRATTVLDREGLAWIDQH